MSWAITHLQSIGCVPSSVALVTKGLEAQATSRPRTYAQTLPGPLSSMANAPISLIGIGGPCIAREIVFRQPTSTVYASEQALARNAFADLLRTPHYRVHTSADLQGVEACAALKNFLTIGVSSTIGKYNLDKAGVSQPAKNPTAALFNQALRELAHLCEWLGGKRDTAFDLAGLGDLHVTVGGGRNSRLGMLLAQGHTISAALTGDLAGETVEGVDTGRALGPGLQAAIDAGKLQAADLPLTTAIVDAIINDVPFEFDFTQLG